MQKKGLHAEVQKLWLEGGWPVEYHQWTKTSATLDVLKELGDVSMNVPATVVSCWCWSMFLFDFSPINYLMCGFFFGFPIFQTITSNVHCKSCASQKTPMKKTVRFISLSTGRVALMTYLQSGLWRHPAAPGRTPPWAKQHVHFITIILVGNSVAS